MFIINIPQLIEKLKFNNIIQRRTETFVLKTILNHKICILLFQDLQNGSI